MTSSVGSGRGPAVRSGRPAAYPTPMSQDGDLALMLIGSRLLLATEASFCFRFLSFVPYEGE
jgi:hypothetical protein